MTDDSLSNSLHELGDNVSRLVSAHLSLAQAELRRESGELIADSVLIVLGLGAVCAGYLVLMGGLVVFLRRWMDVELAALCVGLANVVLGGGFATLALMRLKRRTHGRMPLLEQAVKEDVPFLEKALAGESADMPRPSSAER